MGRVVKLVLSNISTDGCGMEAPAANLKPGEIVVIRPPALEGLSGRVCWVKGNRAGVKFDRPLYGPVVEHLVRVEMSSPVPQYRSLSGNPPKRSSRW